MGAVDKTGWVLGTVLAKQGRALRDKPFVQFQNDPPYTFGDMDTRANRVANALAALGVQQDERVLLMLPNSVAFLDAWFGINRLGAVMVPINTAYKGGFLEHVINNAAVNGSARVMIIDREFVPVLQASEDRVPRLETVVVRGTGGSATDLPTFSRLRAVSFDTLLDAPPTPVNVPVAYHDIGAIMYTSGTTGPSKGVLMPHAHLYLYGHAKIKGIHLTPDDRVLLLHAAVSRQRPAHAGLQYPDRWLPPRSGALVQRQPLARRRAPPSGHGHQHPRRDDRVHLPAAAAP